MILSCGILFKLNSLLYIGVFNNSIALIDPFESVTSGIGDDNSFSEYF